LKLNVNFDCTTEEGVIATEIARRAYSMAVESGLPVGEDYILCIRMDIIATHMNGCPLDLQKLLDADDFNFAHDINGIYHNIDCNTGKLTNFFLPRCCKKGE
jgi:hypothetical protein